MIIFDRLWETMKAKKVSQYRLIKYYGFSAGQIGRLKKNAYVSTHTVNTLCTILNCKVEDIMEFRMDAPFKAGRKYRPNVLGETEGACPEAAAEIPEDSILSGDQ